ncbi:glutaredoxin 3 [Alkalibacter rhizosphaerae]|uniref:Glutaredoxin n=1 Tax=Alkalibacter rhizosphaerae TaxID=2815577 RepID=A0A974XDQ2_9FIRM|nr:glutaredoxin 3 [Alkalibacter rhizosphaerae]QSX07933.1 glutaredoxin 3 [Alkalibacter rhizosphaerae]
MKKKIKLYTWSYCPYCKRATALLKHKNLAFTEIGIDGDPDAFEKLAAKTGQRSVPFIFIEDEFIGGYDELKALEDQNALEKMVL